MAAQLQLVSPILSPPHCLNLFKGHSLGRCRWILCFFKWIKKTVECLLNVFHPERWNIQSAHPITLFAHFKTNTKSIDIYRVLRCCVLKVISKHTESHEKGQANQRPQISINDEHSIYSISQIPSLCLELNLASKSIFGMRS